MISDLILKGIQSSDFRLNQGRSPHILVIASGQANTDRGLVSASLAQLLAAKSAKVLLITDSLLKDFSLFDLLVLPDDLPYWFDDFPKLTRNYDVVIYDCSEQMNSDSLRIMMRANTLVLVVTDSKDSIFSTYNFLKNVATKLEIKHLKLLIDQSISASAAFSLFQKISRVIDKFLLISVDYLGFLPLDSASNSTLGELNKKDKVPTGLMQLCLNNLGNQLCNPLFENDRLISR